MKLISGIPARSALSLSSLFLFLSFESGKAFSCLTTTTTKYPPCHNHHGPKRRILASNDRFESQGISANSNANHPKETRLFSIPKYIAQEIWDLFHASKVRSSSLLGQQQDKDDDDNDKGKSTMNVLLQELADHYDASDAQGKHELLQRVDDQIEELAERIAVLKSLSEHLQMGDDYLLEDQEVSAMKRFLWTTASSLKCGKHVEYLDGKEINGLKTEIISAIQKGEEKNDQSMELFNLQEDYYLETKMKQEEESYDQHSYDAWLGF